MRKRNGEILRKSLILLTILLFSVAAILGGCVKKGEQGADDSSKSEKSGKVPLLEQKVSLAEYPAWIKKYNKTRKWKTHSTDMKLDRETLLESMKFGTQFMAKNQKPEGNFNYEYDWVKKIMNKDDNQVRQAGALWGMGLIYLHNQDPIAKEGLDKALKFFFKHTVEGPEPGMLTVAYPGDTLTSTGTVALVALGIIEYFRAEKIKPVLPEKYKADLQAKLDGYLKFLVWCKLDNKHFSRGYSILKKEKRNSFSPYFDGEIMLCLVKAAKYLGYKEIVPVVEDSAMKLAKDYTVDQWNTNPDSDQTKGFFQWSCMTFWEYMDAGYKDAEVFGDYVLSMGWWMIHTHKTLKRRRNTAYAYEGIVHAYKVAVARNDQDAINDLGYTIDRGLYKLTSWQVKGPLANLNKYLVDNSDKADDPLAIGGIMNHRSQAPLRIDVTQHQMHAVIQALQNVYPASKAVETAAPEAEAAPKAVESAAPVKAVAVPKVAE